MGCCLVNGTNISFVNVCCITGFLISLKLSVNSRNHKKLFYYKERFVSAMCNYTGKQSMLLSPKRNVSPHWVRYVAFRQCRYLFNLKSHNILCKSYVSSQHFLYYGRLLANNHSLGSSLSTLAFIYRLQFIFSHLLGFKFLMLWAPHRDDCLCVHKTFDASFFDCCCCTLLWQLKFYAILTYIHVVLYRCIVSHT